MANNVKEYTAAFTAKILCLKEMDPATITQADIPDIIPADVIADIQTIADIELLVALIRVYGNVIRPLDTPQLAFRGVPLMGLDLLEARYWRLRKAGAVRGLDHEEYIRLFGK